MKIIPRRNKSKIFDDVHKHWRPEHLSDLVHVLTDSQFVDLIGIGHYLMVPGFPAPCMHRDVSVFASRNIQGIIQSVLAPGIPFGEYSKGIFLEISTTRGNHMVPSSPLHIPFLPRCGVSMVQRQSPPEKMCQIGRLRCCASDFFFVFFFSRLL